MVHLSHSIFLSSCSGFLVGCCGAFGERSRSIKGLWHPHGISPSEVISARGEGGRRIEYGGGNIWQQQCVFFGEDTPTAAVEKLLVCTRISLAETYIHTNIHLLCDVWGKPERAIKCWLAARCRGNSQLPLCMNWNNWLTERVSLWQLSLMNHGGHKQWLVSHWNA